MQNGHSGLATEALRIYKERLRPEIETAGNLGKVLILDADSGDYEIDSEGLAANQRLRARRPDLDSHRLFAIRIGFDATYAVGGAPQLTTR